MKYIAPLEAVIQITCELMFYGMHKLCGNNNNSLPAFWTQICLILMGSALINEPEASLRGNVKAFYLKIEKN